MEEACEIIERLVTDEIRRRPYRYPLEWAGGGVDSTNDLIWRANVAASNRYEGRNESVGWHSDHMTYLGPHCTIGGFVCTKISEETTYVADFTQSFPESWYVIPV